MENTESAYKILQRKFILRNIDITKSYTDLGLRMACHDKEDDPVLKDPVYQKLHDMNFYGRDGVNDKKTRVIGCDPIDNRVRVMIHDYMQNILAREMTQGVYNYLNSRTPEQLFAFFYEEAKDGNGKTETD